MKILVTGATGFIGRHLLHQLSSLEHQVIASGSNDEPPADLLVDSKTSYIPLDLDKFDDSVNYFEKFEKPDLLIHLAWQGLPNYKALFHYEKNLPLHYNFLKNILSNGLKSLSVTGTCFEYGLKDGMLTEEMCADPRNPYAIAKDSLRKFLEQLQSQMPFTFRWIRLFYMYGSGQNANSLLSQLQIAIRKGEKSFNMSGGQQLRDYLPVEKVAENIISVSSQDSVTGIINCCSGEPVKVIDFVKELLREMGSDIELNTGYYPYPDYEAMAFWGDNSKLKTIIS